MNKKKKWLKWLVIPVSVCVIIGGILLGCGIAFKESGVYVKNSVFTPYSYTLYEDYAVLETYHGEDVEVSIPKTVAGKQVKQIGYECFAGNLNLNSVILNENVETIGVRAFAECENLVEVTGGVKVINIDNCAFDTCEKLENVGVGGNLERIGKLAFADCSSLTTMIQQDNLDIIEKSAFVNAGLEEFAFNRDVELKSRPFVDTNWIKNQEEEFIIYGDGNLIGYTGSDEIVMIPEGVKILNGGCFQWTTAKEIYLPETVETIREFVFLDCNNVRVYIPDSVVHMGDEEGKYHIMNSDVSITIVTTADSYAHQYAIENEIPYEIVEGW